MKNTSRPAFPKPNQSGLNDNTKQMRTQLIADCDKLANQIVKVRDKRICQRCGTKHGTMDWAHYYSRGSAPTLRWHSMNTVNLCHACHVYFDTVNRDEFTELMESKFGAGVFANLAMCRVRVIKLNYVSLTEKKAGLENELKTLKQRRK